MDEARHEVLYALIVDADDGDCDYCNKDCECYGVDKAFDRAGSYPSWRIRYNADDMYFDATLTSYDMGTLTESQKSCIADIIDLVREIEPSGDDGATAAVHFRWGSEWQPAKQFDGSSVRNEITSEDESVSE